MKSTVRFKVKKLVRSCMLERHTLEDVSTVTRILDADEYRQALREKLVEEAVEAAQSEGHTELTSELADVLEVIRAIAEANDISLEAIEMIRLAKLAERGGFEERLYCESVEVPEGSPRCEEYRNSPDKYPEIDEF